MDIHANLVLKLEAVQPVLNSNNEFEIPSADGSEIYVFGDDGRHRLTKFAKTGETKLSFEYDQSTGLLSALVDSFGNQTAIERGSSGWPTAVVTPYGQRFELTVDNNGGLTSFRTPTGDAYTMTYNPSGLMASFTKPKGNQTSFQYDDFGNLTRETDAAGGFQSIIASPSGSGSFRVTREGSQLSTYYTIDAHNNSSLLIQKGSWWSKKATYSTRVSSESTSELMQHWKRVSTDPRFGGFASYNSFTNSIYPSGMDEFLRTTRDYTQNGPYDFVMLERRQHDLGFVDIHYDSQDRRVVTQTSAGKLLTQQLDQFERPILSQLADDLPVNFSYDSRGRLASTDQGERHTEFTYDTNGFLRSIRDPLGRVSEMRFDASGRMTQSQNPLQETTQYHFDGNGNLAEILLPTNVLHEFSQNLVDLMSGYKTPLLREMTLEYDFDKSLSRITRADGEVVSFEYESGPMRRKTAIQTSSQSIVLSPRTGSLNQLSQVGTSDGSIISYSYLGDALQSKTYSGPFWAEINYGYGSNVLLPYSISVGPSTINLTYNSDRDLVTIAGLTIYYHLASGRVFLTTSGVVRAQSSYSNFGELQSLSFSNGASIVFDQLLTRDTLGRIIKSESPSSNSSTNYTYDLAGRLSTALSTINGQTHSTQYTYDANGNRRSRTRDNLTLLALYDQEDRLLSYGDLIFEYNDHGDLKKKTNTTTGDTTTYTYNQLGQLTQVTLPDLRQITYTIDGEGKRQSKSVNGVVDTYYVYDFNGRLVAELNPSGSLRSHFVYAIQSHSPDLMIKYGVTYRLAKDHLGSIRAVVNTQTGEVAQQINYDEFGVVIEDTNPGYQPFGFAGGHYDPDTKLVRFGARDYDADVGRWTSKDPILFDGGDGNLFGYVYNDPVNLVDPEGFAATQANDWTYAGPIGGGGLIVPIFTPDLAQPTWNEKHPWPKGPQGGESELPNGNKRFYDKNGNPLRDEDWAHDRGHGVPHVHDWIPKPDGSFERGPGRPPRPGECK